MATALDTRSSLPPQTRLLGNASRWSRDGALVGGITAYAGAAFALFGWSLHPWLLGCAAAGALAGGALGLSAPTMLDHLRRQVPLPVLAVALPLFAALVAADTALVAASLLGAPLFPALVFASVAGLLQTAVFWLPYTVAAVLDLPRWPVLLAACVAAPMTGPISKVVALTLF